MMFGFLEQALREGEYVTTPETMVTGNYLDNIQGWDVVLLGVSGKKVVVFSKRDYLYDRRCAKV